MRRLWLNGSPRGAKSNSRVLLSFMAEGLVSTGAEPATLLELARTREVASHVEAFARAEEVILALPLYTDSMPAIVKRFLEAAGQLPAEQLRGKRIGFVVHSGFPEAIHTEALGEYLKRLTVRWEMVHIGTLRQGGIEGIQLQPLWMQKKRRALYAQAGRELGTAGTFSLQTAAKLAGPRTFGPGELAFLRVLIRLGIANWYWNHALLRHGAFARRFDAPYGQAFAE